MKKYLAVVIVAIVVCGGYLWFSKKTAPAVSEDYKNATYEIDGQRVTLQNGSADVVAGDDSFPKSLIRYFGNEVKGDFNADGLDDVAFLLTQDNGGSGTFYYAVAALKTETGYVGTNGIFLGDRIAPQTTEFRDGQIIVNYADRKPDEPMTTTPSVGISKYLKIVDGKLTEVN